jgi:hypothetical protein
LFTPWSRWCAGSSVAFNPHPSRFSKFFGRARKRIRRLSVVGESNRGIRNATKKKRPPSGAQRCSLRVPVNGVRQSSRVLQSPWSRYLSIIGAVLRDRPLWGLGATTERQASMTKTTTRATQPPRRKHCSTTDPATHTRKVGGDRARLNRIST